MLFVIKYSYLILIIFKQIYLINRSLTDTNAFNQSGPGSNGNDLITSYSLDLQIWSHAIKCSLISYPGYLFFFLEGSFILCIGYICISKSTSNTAEWELNSLIMSCLFREKIMILVEVIDVIKVYKDWSISLLRYKT